MPFFSCFRKTLDVSSVDDEDPCDRDQFFVITAIFNPASFSSRYQLYYDFAQHMRDTGATLVTIEAIFPSLGQETFVVTDPSSNPYHIQVESKSIYWMKENLINLAVSKLPPHAKWVAWLDADISFHKKNWVDLTIKALKRSPVVQMFQQGHFLGPSKETLRTDYSFGYSVVHGKIIDQKRYEEWYPHPGYGWAMTMDAFRAIGGLPEYDIVGSGDLHFAFSLLNRVSNALEDDLHPDFKALVLDSSQRTYDTLRKGGPSVPVGYVPMCLDHHWHGSRKDRQYVERWRILIAHQFNFLKDMRRTEEGLLEFVEGRESLQADILAHFQIRREDDTTRNGHDYKKKKSKQPLVMGVPMMMNSRVKNRRGSSSSSSSDDDGGRVPFVPDVPPPPEDCPCPICPPPDDPSDPGPCPPPPNPNPGQDDPCFRPLDPIGIFPGEGTSYYSHIETSTQY